MKHRKTHETSLTPEQIKELEALVRIANAIAAHKRWTYEVYDKHLKFLLSCWCCYRGISMEQLPHVIERVNAVSLEQMMELQAEFGRLQA